MRQTVVEVASLFCKERSRVKIHVYTYLREYVKTKALSCTYLEHPVEVCLPFKIEPHQLRLVPLLDLQETSNTYIVWLKQVKID